MDKLEKNIQRVVAAKAITDIHKTITEEKVSEQRVKRSSLASLGVLFFLLTLFSVYFFVWK